MYVDFGITPYCNLYCDFCYAKANIKEEKKRRILTAEEINAIFDEFDELGVMRVGFEGGEPFIRKDWFEIFKYADQHYFNYFVNTNGTLITTEVADKLKSTNIDKVCVSLDGSSAEIHDTSRGHKGTFQLTIQGIKNLLKANINVDGVITLTQYNKDDILNILMLLADLGVENVAIMLLANVGSAYESENNCLMSYEELKRVVLELTNLKKRNALPVSLSIVPVGEGITPWEMYLPLKESGQLNDLSVWGGDILYNTLKKDEFGCTAGKDNFYINAYGDVYGCSMMSSQEALKAGNFFEKSIKEIWTSSEIFKMLRNLKIQEVQGNCKNCEALDICKGGCRACAYEATRKINGADLRCPLNNK